jgi:hypothetical protein
VQSSQGLRLIKGSGSSLLWKTSTEVMRCVQVVPTFAGVEITMSPGRGSYFSQWVLSVK